MFIKYRYTMLKPHAYPSQSQLTIPKIHTKFATHVSIILLAIFNDVKMYVLITSKKMFVKVFENGQ